MSNYIPLSAGAQTSYSELFDQAQLAELRRSIASLDGTIQEKTVSGKIYAYFAYRDAITKKVRQIYIGPKSDATERLRVKLQDAKKREKDAGGTDLVRQSRAAIELGCVGVIRKHYRILKQIADAQFFRAGGVLIGSHAFIAMGNMLGVRWSSSTRTNDLDFAHMGIRKLMEVALPSDIDIDVDSAIKALDMGYLPGLTLDGKSSGTYVSNKDEALRIDFLTPMGRHNEPFMVPKLGISVQPIRFMDYLIEAPTKAVLISAAGNGAILINVPNPARFALHKLLVSGERPVNERAKATKDVTQASLLIECLLDQSPDLILEAWHLLAKKGNGWVNRVRKSLKRMEVEYPEVYKRLMDEIMDGVPEVGPA